MTPQKLTAETFPLHGSRLIEASAGTGKTWTIAALYLRLVLGHGAENSFSRPLQPPEILVMTFTRAATRELSERIRARLVEAVACFRGEQAVSDKDGFLRALLADYSADPAHPQRQRAAWQLALAAESMDEAAIHTIDAWCQRMLREHAFDSGNLFEETLEADEAERHTQAVQDYWRQQVYPLNGDTLEALLTVWKNLDALQSDMQALCRAEHDSAHGQGAAQTLIERIQQQRQTQLNQLAQGWTQQAQDLQDWLEGQLAKHKSDWDGRKLQARYYQPWINTLRAWADAPHPELAAALKTGAQRLVPDGLHEAYKGSAFQAPPQSQALQDLLQQLELLPQLSSALRLHAAVNVQARLQWLKRQAGSYGFADMLQRLDKALSGAQGPQLRARILAQYPVALIDEFQDTSPLQYRLFNHLYRTADNAPDSALLLIGDPKQSIYGFRGADIYSYLEARQATTGRHYVLDTNYRSAQAMVDAVNHWFTQAEQRPGSGAFMFQQWQDGVANNPLPFLPVHVAGRPERFESQQQAVPALTIAWHSAAEPLKTDALQEHLAHCCAERIARWLLEPSCGFAQPDTPLQRLRPRDIAILVRTGAEARAVRQQLQRRGLASVYLSDQESVFTSAEAQDLLLWLQAVMVPLDSRAVRAALATRLMDLSLTELAQLAQDDSAFDRYSEQLQQLHHIWQRQGVLAMLRQSLHRLALPARWLTQPGGERRLTNVLHLAELLQQHSATLEGQQALVRWLAQQTEQPSSAAQEQIVRLESDADLIQIVTIHKSKGLEYPIVMLPFAALYRSLSRKNTPLLQLPQADGTRQLLLDYDDTQLAQADTERLREDLRLLYVALTRARHAIWLGWGPLRKGNTKDCANQGSASGYLLGGDSLRSSGDWLAQWQQLAQGCPAIHIQALPAEPTRTRWHASSPAPALPSSTPYSGQFDRSWGIASFSALMRASDTANTWNTQHWSATRQASDEALAAAPATMANSHTSNAATTPVWHHFARGPLVGNFIHAQLQWLAEEGFALPADAQNATTDTAANSYAKGTLAERLLRRCAHAGYQEQGPSLLQWLAVVLHQRLPSIGTSLAELAAADSRHHILAEMEFWLPLAQLPLTQLDALCQAHILPGQPRPPLRASQVHGMLMGFADLVFCHTEGETQRYWVLDYKSNHLGADASAYDGESLAQAMLEHRYDVQAALYLLALHRLLGQRLGAQYQSEHHLGGALYYFLRGLDNATAGVQTIQAPTQLLQALDALITEANNPTETA